MKLHICRIDYKNPKHAGDLIDILQHYAQDPMGGAEPLCPEVTKNLCPRLSQYPNAFSFIAYLDDNAAGLINCFESMSTFTARPLVNIHDLCVKRAYRGRGLGQALLEAVEQEAIHRGCVKVTLEVLSKNSDAQRLYLKQGFKHYELDPKQGRAEFWQKLI